MKPSLIKTSKGLINLNNVTTIEKIDGQGSMKYGIRFGLLPHTGSIYESYETEKERDAAYEGLFNIFGYKLKSYEEISCCLHGC